MKLTLRQLRALEDLLENATKYPEDKDMNKSDLLEILEEVRNEIVG